MIDGLATATVICALVVGAACLLQTCLDRPVGVVLMAGAATAELVLIAQVVAVVVEVARGRSADEPLVFVLYLIASVVALPLGVWWSMGERTRWGSAVLGVACLSVAIVIVRLGQVWENTGG